MFFNSLYITGFFFCNLKQKLHPDPLLLLSNWFSKKELASLKMPEAAKRDKQLELQKLHPSIASNESMIHNSKHLILSTTTGSFCLIYPAILASNGGIDFSSGALRNYQHSRVAESESMFPKVKLIVRLVVERSGGTAWSD
jgi:hypothetical protein